MTSNNIIITEQDQGRRLDIFLTDQWPHLSRSQIQKLIKKELILVNGKKTTVHRFLKKTDRITLSPEEKIKDDSGTTSPRLAPPPIKTGNPDKIKIIAKEPNFWIIEKPAGLLVHPTEKNETDTLVDWLVNKCPELKKIGENPARAGIVHRLDKEVSGLMIVPTTQTSFDYFKQQFKDHTITKKYQALVHGEIERPEQEINFPISRSNTKTGLFAAHPAKQEGETNLIGKKALTYFKVLAKYKNYTLLEVEIFTGRTHQIRVHLLAYGHPIVGDKLYKTRKQKATDLTDRIFLHATQLSFVGPNHQTYNFTSPLPKSLAAALAKLSGQAPA